MKRRWAVVPLVLLLTGCSSIDSGTITNKAHEEARSYYTTQCHHVGKVTTCYPQYHYDDEDWRFDLREEVDPSDHKEPATGWVYVSQSTFDAYDVGDYFEGGE